MTHPVLDAELAAARTPQRWSPRVGYALAIGGSALVWSAVVALAIALI